MKSNQRLGLGLALAGLSCVVVPACGDSKDGSLLDMNGGGGSSAASANGDAGDGSGIHLDVGGDGNGSTGGDGMGEGGGCGFTRFEANPPVINVLLVVDKSLSMDDKPTGFADNKWKALLGALDTTFSQTKAKISYGLDLFPYTGKSGEAATTCEMPSPTAAVVVPVEAGTKSAPLILAALDANPPSGATPTAAALTRAYNYFSTGAGKGLTGEKYVLLATDGGPNCNADLTCEAATCTANLDGKCPPHIGNCCDPKEGDERGPENCLDQDASVAQVKRLLAEANVKTIVVGIPGTEAYAETLDALAAESGVTNPEAPPGYFAVSADSGAEGLSAALQGITTGLVKSCELHLEEEPPGDDLYVVIDGVVLPRNADEGWGFQTPKTSPPVVEIRGAACHKLETDGAEYINVSYGCPDFRPPVK